MIQDMEISSQTTPTLLMPLIGVLTSLENTIPMGLLPIKTNWQYPQSLDSSFKPSDKTSSVVER